MSKTGIFEDPYSAKLDMCITDGIVKTGSGALLGALSSLLFLGRRRWPLIVGMGMGMGIAYANCENELRGTNAATACVSKPVTTYMGFNNLIMEEQSLFQQQSL